MGAQRQLTRLEEFVNGYVLSIEWLFYILADSIATGHKRAREADVTSETRDERKRYETVRNERAS